MTTKSVCRRVRSIKEKKKGKEEGKKQEKKNNLSDLFCENSFFSKFVVGVVVLRAGIVRAADVGVRGSIQMNVVGTTALLDFLFERCDCVLVFLGEFQRGLYFAGVGDNLRV